MELSWAGWCGNDFETGTHWKFLAVVHCPLNFDVFLSRDDVVLVHCYRWKCGDDYRLCGFRAKKVDASGVWSAVSCSSCGVRVKYIYMVI